MIHEATRTLVKSPPEVWEQCSDPESLARHLNGSFGEIRITRLEPESTVAWEGEHGSGTVTIEPSAWGTRVTLTAESAAEAAPEPVPEPEPEPELPPPESRRQSLMEMLLRRWRRPPPAPPPRPMAPDPPPQPDERSTVLMAALESMGQAHHRPYSRG